MAHRVLPGCPPDDATRDLLDSPAVDRGSRRLRRAPLTHRRFRILRPPPVRRPGHQVLRRSNALLSIRARKCPLGEKIAGSHRGSPSFPTFGHLVPAGEKKHKNSPTGLRQSAPGFHLYPLSGPPRLTANRGQSGRRVRWRFD